MIFLLLAILSSALIAILMRLSSNRIGANLSMLAINYLVCALLGAAYTGFQPAQPTEPGFGGMVLLGVITGSVYLGGFMLCQYNTRKHGIVMTSIFMKLGLLVPVILSMVLFREVPTGVQIAGFCIAVAAIIAINLQKGQGGKGFGFSLIFMLLMCGNCDAMSKIYERMGPAALSDSYLLVTFAAAFALCALLALGRKEKPGLRELFFGCLIGIPNFFSAKFLLAALTKLPAVVVYPSFSVATLLLVTLTGIILFRERLRKLQWAALAAILVALALLNI
jgi:drug/metabolite transporter (DMT)-like permease